MIGGHSISGSIRYVAHTGKFSANFERRIGGNLRVDNAVLTEEIIRRIGDSDLDHAVERAKNTPGVYHSIRPKF